MNASPDSGPRVLAVRVEAAVVHSLLPWHAASTLQVETESDLLHAVERLLNEEWDLVVTSLGDEVAGDLRPWLEALEEARGRPRLVALVRQESAAVPASGVCTLAELEARHIARVMKEAGGRIEAAARVLGIHRNTLTRKLKGLASTSANSA